MNQGGMVAIATPVVVYGPQGCGKTRHAKALAAHFGVERVIDDWMPGDPVDPGALHLSQVEVPGAVAYESLKAELGLLDPVPEDAGPITLAALVAESMGTVGMVTMTLDAEGEALLALLDQIRVDLESASPEVRELALYLISQSSELWSVEECVAKGVGVTVLFEPSKWLCDLAAAVRAGDLEWLTVEHTHRKAPVVACAECRGAGTIRRPYSAVERIPCPMCASAHS